MQNLAEYLLYIADSVFRSAGSLKKAESAERRRATSFSKSCPARITTYLIYGVAIARSGRSTTKLILLTQIGQNISLIVRLV
jgi:hypothetical protein